jgi:hypothetical protein
MQSMLRKLVLAAAVPAVVALAANTANAENKVNVPFSFQVAGKTLPAGSYNVDSRDGGHVLQSIQFESLVTPRIDKASKNADPVPNGQ